MEKLNTIDIKGKPYVLVNERIKHFRAASEYKGWRLVSEIIEMDDTKIVIKANVIDNNDKIIATGLAYEKQNGSFINKTSYIENCETSAWGRALGNLGIGVDTSIATAEELTNALMNQKSNSKTLQKCNEQEEIQIIKKITKEQVKELFTLAKEDKNLIQNVIETAGYNKSNEIPFKEFENIKKLIINAVKGGERDK